MGWNAGTVILGGSIPAYNSDTLAPGAVTASFIGSLAQARLHGSALSQTDIQTASRIRYTGQEPGILALWNLDCAKLIDQVQDNPLTLGNGTRFFWPPSDLIGSSDYAPTDAGWQTVTVPSTAP